MNLKEFIEEIREKRYHKGLTKIVKKVCSDIRCIGPGVVINKEQGDIDPEFLMRYALFTRQYGDDLNSHNLEMILYIPEKKVKLQYYNGNRLCGECFTVNNERLFDNVHEGQIITLVCKKIKEVIKDYKPPNFSNREVVYTEDTGMVLDSVIVENKVVYRRGFWDTNL